MACCGAKGRSATRQSLLWAAAESLGSLSLDNTRGDVRGALWVAIGDNLGRGQLIRGEAVTHRGT